MKHYRKKGTTPMTPWTPETDMSGVSVSQDDLDDLAKEVVDRLDDFFADGLPPYMRAGECVEAIRPVLEEALARTYTAEQDAASAAKWCGWEHFAINGTWNVPGMDLGLPDGEFRGDLGAMLLLAAIKRKLVEEGLHWSADGTPSRSVVIIRLAGRAARLAQETAPTELDAFLAVLRAMGKIGGDGE